MYHCLRGAFRSIATLRQSVKEFQEDEEFSEEQTPEEVLPQEVPQQNKKAKPTVNDITVKSTKSTETVKNVKRPPANSADKLEKAVIKDQETSIEKLELQGP